MSYVAKRFEVTKLDRRQLEGWLRAPTVSQARAVRAKVILGSAAGEGTRAMARRLGISPATVCRWRGRYAKSGLAGLQTETRSGRPLRIGEAEERRVVEATLRPPKEATHWSTRRLARRLGMSASAAYRIWRKYGLQPHRTRTFKFSKDPEFNQKLADVVGLYLDPPERALVLCVDEKSQIQALQRTQPILPLRPGPARGPHPRLRATRDD
jgi:transposase